MKLLICVLFIASTAATLTQTLGPAADLSELPETVARLDAQMFDAFNAHDTAGLMALFSEDLEFYHDKGGLTDYQQTADNFKKLFASAPDIRRALVPGTLEIYPIKDYGAIEIGTHRFTHTENGKEETGTFKFLHIWRKTGDTWKTSRIVSYGH